MPVQFKMMLSLVMLVVAAAGAWFLDWLGHDTTPWVAIFLGVFAVASFWVFPEVNNKKDG